MTNDNRRPLTLGQKLEAAADPLEEAAKLLCKALARFAGRPLNRRSLDEIDEVIEQFRNRMRDLYGVRIPPLTALVMRRIGHVEVCRADLSPGELQTIVLNVAVKRPEVTPEDLAEAVARAFPRYRAHIDPTARRATKTHNSVNLH